MEAVNFTVLKVPTIPFTTAPHPGGHWATGGCGWEGGEGVVIASSKGVRFSLSLGHLEHYKRTYMRTRGCA